MINVSVTKDVVSCILFYGAGLQRDMDAHNAGAATTADVRLTSPGTYVYYVTCYDSDLNPGSTETRTLFIPQPEETPSQPQLALSVNSSCGGNTVTVTSDGQLVSGARVSIDDAVTFIVNETDSGGQVSFGGCGKNVTIRATASGYSAAEAGTALVDCSLCAPPIPCDCGFIRVSDGQCIHYPCCADSQCGRNETCVSHSCEGGGGGQPLCIAPSCCRTDADCGRTERCDIPAGAETGRCVPVTGCGIVDNHSLVEQWACGDGPSCPPCPGGYVCLVHQCIRGTVSAPTNIYVGSNTTIHAEINDRACASCEIEITDPAGRKFVVTTDAGGDAVLPLEREGIYNATLVRNRMPLSSVAIRSLRPPAVVPVVPVTLIQGQDLCLLALLVLLALFILYLRWRAKKGAEPAAKAAPGKTKAAPAKP